MNKYKIGKYIVKADSICDAVTIVKTIKNSVKDADEYMIEGNIVDKDEPTMTYQAYQNIARKYHLTIKNYTGDMLDLYGSKDNLKRYEHDMHMSYSSIEKAHDSVKDSRRINYDDDIIEVTLNGKVVFRGYAEDWLDDNFDSNFKWTGSQYEASNTKGKWVVRVVDSFQKDSLTVRDVIQSLINEETSAISSYNVALETLKDHIPAEAYEAIKAIRDDEQRHVENLYAVLNGNVTPKNLEN